MIWEGLFATFFDSLMNGGRIDLSSAAGYWQSHYNEDFVHYHQLLATGQKGNK